MKDSFATAGIHQSIKGRVQCQIVDSRTKKVLKTFPWQNNLILNQGMNNYGTTYANGFISGFLYAVAGTGTTPTRDDSGTTQAAQSGTGVTLTGGSFVFTDTGTDAGKMIKWDSGEEAMILTITNPTTAVVTNSATVASGEFTVYRTNQTGLSTEVKRSNNYVAGVGSCETIQSPAHVLSHKRTYDFSAEVGSVTYNELGFSHVATVASNLFSRILLSSPVSLIATQQLRVLYQLTITWGPSGTSAKTADIPGWPVAPASTTDGDEAWESLGMSNAVATSGATGSADGGGLSICDYLDPSIVVSLHSDSPAFPGSPRGTAFVMNSGILAEHGSMLWESYVANSFTGVKYYVLTTTQGNFNTIRGICFGRTVVTSHYVCFRFLFDEAQTKDNLHKLTVRLRYTWTRVLG